MSSSKLLYIFIFFLSTTLARFRYSFASSFQIYRTWIFLFLIDSFFAIYFRFCRLKSITVDLNDQTTLHFWTTTRRKLDKPNLVMIHGLGGDARWQFLYQVGLLSRKFNLYIPDLLFFGKSYSNHPERSEVFQARCLLEGLKRLGVDKFSVYSLSYGGYVGYRMAEICPKGMMEKLVIVSSGINWVDEEKKAHINKFERDPKELLLPTNPHDMRILVEHSVYKSNPLKWFPDFFIQDMIDGMAGNHRQEKLELVEHLMKKKADKYPPIITQETLIVWGDQDNIFPVYLADQLRRHLGPKSRVQIIKDVGHAVNIECPHLLNTLITSFVLGHS